MLAEFYIEVGEKLFGMFVISTAIAERLIVSGSCPARAQFPSAIKSHAQRKFALVQGCDVGIFTNDQQ